MTSNDFRAPQAREAGFTLIELMIALVVISIGILALSAVQTRSSRDVYRTGRGSEALAMAQAGIESMRAAGFDSVATDTSQSGPFEMIRQVTAVSTDMKQLTVVVNWAEDGDPRSLQIQTLLSDR